MKDKYLILDVSNICYKNYYSIKSLHHKEVSTGVLFGFFRDILYLQELHQTDKFCFCFDYGSSFRTNHLADYKQGRKQKFDSLELNEKESMRTLHQQIYLLRNNLLSSIGYRNILWQEHMEADDIIASLTKGILEKDEDAKVIIVSSDQDLYQLLVKNRVSIWRPCSKSMMTATYFEKKYGISPNHWAKVKAVAGCSSDDIPGVEGVGEKTAIKYLNGNLPKSSNAYQSIKESTKLINRNMTITKLPYAGCKDLYPLKDEFSWTEWDKIMRKYGIKSLVKNIRGVKGGD